MLPPPFTVAVSCMTTGIDVQFRCVPSLLGAKYVVHLCFLGHPAITGVT